MHANSNRNFAEFNKEFRLACDRAGVKPTKRQAAKWRQARGQAYAAHRAAERLEHLHKKWGGTPQALANS